MKQLILVLLLTGLSALPARAQMVTGSGMEDFAKSFGISAKGWSVQQTACSLGANALWLGERLPLKGDILPAEGAEDAVEELPPANSSPTLQPGLFTTIGHWA